VKILTQVEEALQPLKGQKDLVLVLEDWDSGLQVQPKIDGEVAQGVLKAAREKYGSHFAFRAFNSQLDIWWNGEIGIMHDEPFAEQAETVKLFLEPEWRRYPGMQRFGQALCPEERRPNLRRFCVKAIRVPGEQGIFWRFVGLGVVEEGNNGDS
jgi:hypothetical protein